LNIHNREGEETFTVVLSTPTDATITADTGTVTSAPTRWWVRRRLTSPRARGEGGDVTVTITRGGTRLAKSRSTTRPRQLGHERRRLRAASGKVTFAAGETSKTFTIHIVDDGNVPTEGPESFTVSLSTPTAAPSEPERQPSRFLPTKRRCRQSPCRARPCSRRGF